AGRPPTAAPPPRNFPLLGAAPPARRLTAVPACGGTGIFTAIRASGRACACCSTSTCRGGCRDVITPVLRFVRRREARRLHHDELRGARRERPGRSLAESLVRELLDAGYVFRGDDGRSGQHRLAATDD